MPAWTGVTPSRVHADFSKYAGFEVDPIVTDGLTGFACVLNGAATRGNRELSQTKDGSRVTSGDTT